MPCIRVIDWLLLFISQTVPPTEWFLGRCTKRINIQQSLVQLPAGVFTKPLHFCSSLQRWANEGNHSGTSCYHSVSTAQNKLTQKGRRDGVRGAWPASSSCGWVLAPYEEELKNIDLQKKRPQVHGLFSGVLISAFETRQLKLLISRKSSLGWQESGSIRESAFKGWCLYPISCALFEASPSTRL